jgi:hypothetical protein
MSTATLNVVILQRIRFASATQRKMASTSQQQVVPLEDSEDPAGTVPLQM